MWVYQPLHMIHFLCHGMCMQMQLKSVWTHWITVQRTYMVWVFPGSLPSVFQGEKLPAEVSYISQWGVTSLFWGPRSGELGFRLQMGPVGLLPPTDLLSGGGREKAIGSRCSVNLSCWRRGSVLVMKRGSTCYIDGVFEWVLCFLSICVWWLTDVCLKYDLGGMVAMTPKEKRAKQQWFIGL